LKGNCNTCWSDARSGSECTCYLGEYEEGIKDCKACDKVCEACDGAAPGNCTICKDSEHRETPNCECNEGFWDDNGVCKPRDICTKIEIQSQNDVCNSFEIICNICMPETANECMPSCTNGVCSQSDLDNNSNCVAQKCTVGPPGRCDQDTAECNCSDGYY